ncbi:MAG TPA: ankyrin repeat domain-containing protein [Bacteroidales bacterium]|nr:ankyrin repeat domain-containing protein [Bacteroidales bacterium]
MAMVRQSFLWVLFFAAFISHSAISDAQNASLGQKQDTILIIDTSSYVPSDYPYSLEYNLMVASYKGYTSEIIRLLNKGADINASTEEGITPLLFAILDNKLDAVLTLLNYGPDLNKSTPYNETPLLISVKSRFFEITEALIRAGAKIDCTDNYGATPLHYAALNGYLDMVDLLLYYDAPVDAKSKEGITPLMASVQEGYPDVTDLLVQNGANSEVEDNDGYTPFLMSAYYGDTLLMDILYKHGANIYALNKDNYNALDLSIMANQADAVRYLLKKENNWTKPGSAPVDPYIVATKYRRKEMVSLLKSNNVSGNIRLGIDQAAISASSRFGLHDYYTGINLSFKEPYFNLGFTFGCDMKLWYTRVLVKSSEHLYYQYMDKGSVAYAGVFKDFSLSDRLNKTNFFLSASLLGGYSFGNKLKGTLYTPEHNFMAIPSLSIKMTKKNVSLFTGVEYQKTSYYNDGPIWFRIGLSYNYFFDKVRTYVKPVRW